MIRYLYVTLRLLPELVSCLSILGWNLGLRYWRIIRRAALRPELALEWASACRLQTIVQPEDAAMFHRWADELEDNYKQFMETHLEDKQKTRADAWRTYAIHLEVCGCGRGDRRCTRGDELRDTCIVADGLATDGVHNTPHPSSCACRRCNAKRDLAKHPKPDLKATLNEDAFTDPMLIDRGISPEKQAARPTTTPEKISELGPNDVFVFGSNREGIHGKGAAKLALERFGAVRGEGQGHHGQSYAIPTRELDGNRALLRTLALEDIATYVRDFLLYAEACPDLTFYVTKIGCGYAGYSEDEIAPMFLQALVPSNVILPAEFTRLRA